MEVEGYRSDCLVNDHVVYLKSYDIKEGMQEAIVNVRLTVCKKQEPTKDKKKTNQE